MKTLLIKLINWLIRKFDLGNYISDGNHTFNELYAHRVALFYRWIKDNKVPFQLHNVEDDWPIVYFKVAGEWRSYHVPKQVLKYFFFLPNENKGPKIEFDGHTSMATLMSLCYECNWIDFQ